VRVGGRGMKVEDVRVGMKGDVISVMQSLSISIASTNCIRNCYVLRKSFLFGQFRSRIAKLVKRWTHMPKGTGFDPRLDHKRRST
jgi:hypothetical protein